MRTFENQRTQAAWMLTAHDIWRGRHWLTADGQGRVHHTLTSCPRALRPLLRIDGEPVALLDMANAQPFMLLALYPQTRDVAEERELFAATVASGDFYHAVFCGMLPSEKALWSDAAGRLAPELRDDFKEVVFRDVLYSKASGEWPAAMRSLGRNFPWLAGELWRIRSERDGARKLALQMQRTESQLFIGRIFRRIRHELTGCKAVSIHDGVMCQRRFMSDVRRMIEEETEATFGVRPKVSDKSAEDAGSSSLGRASSLRI